MRPRFTDQELTFLLELLREVEASKNRQILSLQEEQQHVQMRVHVLRHRLFFEGPYRVHRELRAERERLGEIEREWLPICNKQAVILRGLIVRLEKNPGTQAGKNTTHIILP